MFENPGGHGPLPSAADAHGYECPYCVIIALLRSGVARVPYALGQEIFFAPSVIKTAELEVKNMRKSAEDVKAEHVPE